MFDRFMPITAGVCRRLPPVDGVGVWTGGLLHMPHAFFGLFLREIAARDANR
ncbi:MAG: hypothetical protein AAGL23_01665 [Pseudomonadota bacterium]